MKNSGSPITIDHKGIVSKTDDKSVTVIISSEAACSGCHAEGACNLSGQKEKIIEIPGSYDVSPGDQVTINMKQSMGYAALFLGYIFPIVPVIIILVFLISINVSELAAGLGAIAVLIPYYIILYFFRNSINEKFTFTIKV
jgi:sigma-E factor negative regulatory protein RseC